MQNRKTTGTGSALRMGLLGVAAAGALTLATSGAMGASVTTHLLYNFDGSIAGGTYTEAGQISSDVLGAVGGTVSGGVFSTTGAADQGLRLI